MRYGLAASSHPSARDHAVSVKLDDTRVGEQASQERASEASNSVQRKAVDGVIEATEHLEAGCEVGDDRRDEANGKGRGGANVLWRSSKRLQA